MEARFIFPRYPTEFRYLTLDIADSGVCRACPTMTPRRLHRTAAAAVADGYRSRTSSASFRSAAHSLTKRSRARALSSSTATVSRPLSCAVARAPRQLPISFSGATATRTAATISMPARWRYTPAPAHAHGAAVISRWGPGGAPAVSALPVALGTLANHPQVALRPRPPLSSGISWRSLAGSLTPLSPTSKASAIALAPRV